MRYHDISSIMCSQIVRQDDAEIQSSVCVFSDKDENVDLAGLIIARCEEIEPHGRDSQAQADGSQASAEDSQAKITEGMKNLNL